MNDAESDPPRTAAGKTHLGFRIAVGVVGLALLAVFVLLGSVTMQQSATTQALEAREPLNEEARPAPDRE
ncbi:MAG: hypothetical protein MUE86_05600 [Thiobacillaceae bacterium]|jgi:NAD/NADP transhydrogenase alpha subunit|nr:hypothetical protein [Thiobacillaceae bacterium]